MVQLNKRSTAWREIAGDIGISFVDAVNDFDADRLIDLFAQDAHVNDQLRDFWGKGAIADWIRREIVGERFCMDVTEARSHFNDLILSAEVGGDFDKTGLPSPLILNFIFSFFDGKIVRLIVLVTRPGETEPDVRVVGT
ncbi:nuclear transport factor 2 family protein [Paraburkholderia sediminicola]|uniref:nuclear transport factor 2 family protein n=1 Tax=Paraburkholderia sediminicola TaxID=458836 RepID=UPI0038B8E4EE